MPQPPGNYGNEACRVSNTGSWKAKHADDDDNLHVDSPSKYDADEDYIHISCAK
jgi:hypothetical protein